MYGLYAATEWKISGMFHKKGDFSLWINRDIVGEDSLKKKKIVLGDSENSSEKQNK